MKRASIVLMVIAIGISTLLVIKLRNSQTRGASVGEAPGIRGQMAPDFALESVDGKVVRLSDFHGKAVLRHFWATSWLPCRVEMQWFKQMHNQYGPQRLEVLGIEMGNTDKTDITDYANNLGIRLSDSARSRARGRLLWGQRTSGNGLCWSRWKNR
jgi:peroxiredoxin